MRQAVKERMYRQEYTASAGLPEGFINSVRSTDRVGGFVAWLCFL